MHAEQRSNYGNHDYGRNDETAAEGPQLNQDRDVEMAVMGGGRLFALTPVESRFDETDQQQVQEVMDSDQPWRCPTANQLRSLPVVARQIFIAGRNVLVLIFFASSLLAVSEVIAGQIAARTGSFCLESETVCQPRCPAWQVEAGDCRGGYEDCYNVCKNLIDHRLFADGLGTAVTAGLGALSGSMMALEISYSQLGALISHKYLGRGACGQISCFLSEAASKAGHGALTGLFAYAILHEYMGVNGNGGTWAVLGIIASTPSNAGQITSYGSERVGLTSRDIIASRIAGSAVAGGLGALVGLLTDIVIAEAQNLESLQDLQPIRNLGILGGICFGIVHYLSFLFARRYKPFDEEISS